MTGKTQAAVAAASWAALATPHLAGSDILAGTAVAVLASTVADLDHEHGAAQTWLPLSLGYALSWLVRRVCSQRGALHAFPAAPLVAGALAFAGTVWWPVWVAPAVVVGYLGGIIPDAFTTSGIPLSPLPGRLRVASFKVGGLVDTTLGVGAAAAAVLILTQGAF